MLCSSVSLAVTFNKILPFARIQMTNANLNVLSRASRNLLYLTNLIFVIGRVGLLLLLLLHLLNICRIRYILSTSNLNSRLQIGELVLFLNFRIQLRILSGYGNQVYLWDHVVDEAIIPLHFLPARSDGGVLFVWYLFVFLGILRRDEIIKLNQKNIPRVISRSSEYSTVRSENRPDIVELCQRQTRQRRGEREQLVKLTNNNEITSVSCYLKWVEYCFPPFT